MYCVSYELFVWITSSYGYIESTSRGNGAIEHVNTGLLQAYYKKIVCLHVAYIWPNVVKNMDEVYQQSLAQHCVSCVMSLGCCCVHLFPNFPNFSSFVFNQLYKLAIQNYACLYGSRAHFIVICCYADHYMYSYM